MNGASTARETAASPPEPLPGQETARLRLGEDQRTAQSGYIPSLDGLRALSVGIVVLAHHTRIKALPGGLGVYIFFVISGFLITRLLLSEHKKYDRVSLVNFYSRRFLRLYPVIVTYALCVVMLYCALHQTIDWVQPLSALLYFANYFYAYHELVPLAAPPMPFGIFWSLSVEEHFYLVFPLLFVLARARPGVLLTIGSLVCLMCLVWRCWALWIRPDLAGTEVLYMRTDFRADSIAFGVMLAAICEAPWGGRVIRMLGHPIIWCAALVVLLGSLALRDPFFRESLRYSVQGAAIAILIAGILFQPWLVLLQRILNSRGLVWIGRLSYSIYVWHYLPRGLYALIPDAHLIPRVAFDLTMTVLLAIISYYLIEKPVLRLRHHVGSRARPAPHL